jgi:hypothetical protein
VKPNTPLGPDEVNVLLLLQANLSAQSWASELGNEICATVSLPNDESWNGVCRIPGLPSCADAIPTAIGATKEEEAIIMIRYAWGANWPVKGTIALTMEIGTEQAFEFGITYELAKEEEPSWENLWILMARAIVADGITLPASVSHQRLDYVAICEKVNQSVHILWRHKLADGTRPRIPQDHGLPVYTIYGAKAELRVRDIERLGCGITGIVRTLYNGEMEMAQIPSSRWSFNAAMRRYGEEVKVPDEVLAKAEDIS